jgi:hypothetical protein
VETVEAPLAAKEKLVQVHALVVNERLGDLVDAVLFLNEETLPLFRHTSLPEGAIPMHFMKEVPKDVEGKLSPSWMSYEEADGTALAKTEPASSVVEAVFEPDAPLPLGRDEEPKAPEEPPFDPYAPAPPIPINALLGAFAGLPGGAMPMPQAVLDIRAGKKPEPMQLPQQTQQEATQQQVFGLTKRARLQSGVGGGPRFGSAGIAMTSPGNGGRDVPDTAVSGMVGRPKTMMEGDYKPRVFFKTQNGKQREITPEGHGQPKKPIRNETDALTAILEETAGGGDVAPSGEKPAPAQFQGTIDFRGSVDGMGGGGGRPL